MRAVVSALLVLAVGSAGCGSTVQLRANTQVQGSLGELDGGTGVPTTLGTAPPQGSGSTVDLEGGTTSAVGGSQQPGAAGESSGSPSGPQGTGSIPGRTGTGPTSGFGFTATKAFLGVEYIDGGDAFLASAGYSSLTTGDAQALVNTIAADINRKGGVLGRRLVPVFQKTDAATGSSNPGTTAQAACAKFTQDDKVFAVVLASPAQACLAKSKVMSMYFSNNVDDEELNKTAPYTRRPTAYSFTQLIPLLINRLVAHRYLTKDSKVGILWPQEPTNSGERIVTDLKRQLTSRGFQVTADYGYDFSSAVAAAGSSPNAVLPFRSAGVDRVISVDASVAYFMTAAEQQGYRPRYALNSNLNLASVMESVPPPRQLEGAVGVGWQPINDVAPANRDLSPPGFASCKKYMNDSGQNPTGFALAILTLYCDSVRLALYAAQSGGGFDSQSLQLGLASKGTSYPSASVLKTAFSDRRMDGARGARDIAFVSGCRCFKYLSRTIYER
jgi:ABC-type branched-subunit amino acid transport system substrate-binding protein